MKRIYFIIIVLFLILIPLHYGWSARYAIIITIDGTRLEGEASSSDNQIEWRKDIYEHKDQDGVYEKFFLKPGLKGKFKLSQIKEIIMINPASAPERYATLEDDSQAKLMQKYRIKLQNGKIFYISDFVTLDSFYIDIVRATGKKRIYISQIKSLKFTGKKFREKIAESKTSKKSSILTSISKKRKTKNGSSAEPTPPSPAYMVFLIILSGMLFVVLIILISIMIRYQSLHRRKTRKVKIKKIKIEKPKRKTLKKTIRKNKIFFVPEFLRKKKTAKMKPKKRIKTTVKPSAKLKIKPKTVKKSKLNPRLRLKAKKKKQLKRKKPVGKPLKRK